MKKFLWLPIALFCFASPAFCGDGEWTAEITPYFWMAGQNGDTVVLGQPSEVDISFSDVIENFDMGLAGHLEFNRNKWTPFFDFQYINVSGKPETVEIRLKNTVLEAGTTYRLHPAFEALGGLRIVNYKLELTPDLIEPVDASKTWVDPFIGGRAIARVSEPFSITGRFDIGGFGAGSDFTWNLILSGSYGWERIALVFGYRAWSVDYESGDGFRELELDLVTSGPFFGLTLRL